MSMAANNRSALASIVIACVACCSLSSCVSSRPVVIAENLQQESSPAVRVQSGEFLLASWDSWPALDDGRISARVNVELVLFASGILVWSEAECSTGEYLYFIGELDITRLGSLMAFSKHFDVDAYTPVYDPVNLVNDRFICVNSDGRCCSYLQTHVPGTSSERAALLTQEQRAYLRLWRQFELLPKELCVKEKRRITLTGFVLNTGEGTADVSFLLPLKF